MRSGLFRSYCGRRSNAGRKASDGNSPAVVPPPPMRWVQVRCGDLIDCASLATAHMKPLSARAMAVQPPSFAFLVRSTFDNEPPTSSEPSMLSPALLTALAPCGTASSRQPSADGDMSRHSRPACASRELIVPRMPRNGDLIGERLLYIARLIEVKVTFDFGPVTYLLM